MKAAVVRAAGAALRTAHGRGYLGNAGSAAVRFLSRYLATTGTYTYRNHYGHLLEADLADYMERAGFFGAHSPRLLQLALSRLQPGDWVIDAGANVGLFASPLSAAVGPHGRVWAVEPLPRNIERLRQMKEANGLSQLEVVPYALSSTASTARLRLPAMPGSSGFGSFVATWPSDGEVEVATRRLDDLVDEADTGRPLRLLKIDVEGYESQLVAGATATLTTRRPLVICEFHDPLLRAAGSSGRRLLSQFADCGYEPSTPSPPGSLDGKVVDLLLVSADEPAR